MADMRKCIGSAKFGIEAHEAPVTDFPAQPSQKDGLGRMCKTHWSQYTSALRKAALARKAAEGQTAATPEVAAAKPAVGTSKRHAPKPPPRRPARRRRSSRSPPTRRQPPRRRRWPRPPTAPIWRRRSPTSARPSPTSRIGSARVMGDVRRLPGGDWLYHRIDAYPGVRLGPRHGGGPGRRRLAGRGRRLPRGRRGADHHRVAPTVSAPWAPGERPGPFFVRWR